MNEQRIQRISKQAGFKVIDNQIIFNDKSINHLLNKFSELLIEEILSDLKSELRYYYEDNDELIESIRDEF